jgi:hypothetical protein
MLSALHTWTLTAISIATGVAMLWIFGRFSDQAAIALAKRKLHAHLLAFRLFADEPRLIFRAQRELLVWNARYLGLMLRPTLVMILPLAALLWHLDAVYGHRPLAPGEAAIVTLQMDGAANLQTVSPSLAGRGVTVETPALRLADEHQVLWCVRAGADAQAVVMQLDGARVEKRVQEGEGLSYLSERRVASWLEWLRYPAESRLPNAPVEWIEVSYPGADIGVFGIGMHWLIWFCIVSLFTMLALRKRFGVTF